MERLTEIVPAGLENCRVEASYENGTVLFRAAAADPQAEQRFLERNGDFGTDQASELAAFTLPLADVPEGMTAIYQHKSWWIRPAFPAGFSQVPERTQLLLWGRKGGGYRAMLAVCDQVCRADLAGCGTGIRVSISANGCPGDRNAHLAVCCGEDADPYRLVETLVSAACMAQGMESNLRKNKRFPEMFRHFGWCTWDAFYHEVNEADILAKLAEFRRARIPVRWLLIDDGWSDADYESSKLNTMDADRSKFPNGLEGTIRAAKTEYGIRQVGVWHALMGYWKGLDPGSPVFRDWESELECRNGDYVLRPENGAPAAFLDRWHSRLADAGVDFVKVDGQGSCSIYYKGEAGLSVAAGYLRALERSADAHFGGNLINCMGMAPQCMWLRHHSPLSRSSDDFVPTVPHGFREHILQNGFNSLLQGQFYWGDWDMFWSDHEENFQNSVARSISGGPVYCSDRPGRTDPAAILPLLDRDGTVNRCGGVGVPTRDCLLSDPAEREGLFKLYNTWADGYAVAAFNLSGDGRTVVDSLRMEQIPGLAGGTWLAYSYFEKKCRVLDGEDPVPLALAADGVEHLLVVPKRPHGQFLGDPEKYICSCTVLEQTASEGRLTGRLQASPEVLFRTDRPPAEVLVNGQAAPFRPADGCWAVSCGAQGEMTVEVRF